MKKETCTFLKRFIPFLVVPLISISGVLLLRGRVFNDLETLLLSLGICEIIGALYIFFQGGERDLPYHGFHDSLRNIGNLTAFFQAKSLMKSNTNTEYRPRLSWLLAWVLCGILLIVGSLYV